MNIPEFRRSSLLALALGLPLGCDSPQYVDSRTVAVSALLASGERAPDLRGEPCAYLPLLLGSRFEGEYPIDRPLAVRLSASRDELRVFFVGTAEPGSAFEPELVLSGEELDEGLSETLQVEHDGQTYDVLLTAPCPAS